MRRRSLEPAFGGNRRRGSGWSVQPKGSVHWHCPFYNLVHALTCMDRHTRNATRGDKRWTQHPFTTLKNVHFLLVFSMKMRGLIRRIDPRLLPVCPFKTPPCVRSKCPRVCRHHAHVLKHMCSCCRHSRGRCESTEAF